MAGAYNRFLAQTSIIESTIDWYEPRLVDFQGLEMYAPGFCAEKYRHFSSNSECLRSRLSSGYFDEAMKGLHEKSPEVAEIARFCVRLIVVNQLSEYTNGTTEDTIGVANFNFKDDYDKLDFQELLVHQLVHMLLFIDDSMTVHMPPAEKEFPLEVGLPFVLGGTAFPIYLAFHSYIVAVEMLAYRKHTGQWDVSPRYHRSTKRIIKIINAFGAALDPELKRFTPRGQHILVQARNLVDHCLLS